MNRNYKMAHLMASNSFGTIFRITTWGESHGKAIGVVIDGCPAGLEIDENEINQALALRAPGLSIYTTSRKEPDRAEILSGVFEGKTSGTPISIIIYNKDADSSKYESTKHLLRPGHANYTYLEKYGVFDYRGGGRSSARETACRMAAGTIAKKLLEKQGIKVFAYLKKVGEIEAFDIDPARTYQNPLYCPDPTASKKMGELILEAKKEGDSLGGVVEFIAMLPPGLGDPVYEKLEANLSHAMMTLPASKAFEIGSGFQATMMKGSSHNDPFILENERVQTETNHAGGTLGGISNGMPVIGRVAFKPASGIMKAQKSLNQEKENAPFQLPEGSRHDPCIAIRAVPVVEAMAALVLIDSLLMNRCAKL